MLNVDDVIETASHFRCIDLIIDNAKAALTEKSIKELHLILKKWKPVLKKRMVAGWMINKRCRMKLVVWMPHFQEEVANE